MKLTKAGAKEKCQRVGEREREKSRERDKLAHKCGF